MLPYILAIAIALGSSLLLFGAFAFPKLHRQDDFLWSGVGLFYALVLWLCAGRLTGGVLLGQAAATCLLLAFGWQTVKLRRALAYPDSQTELEGFSLTRWLGSRLGKTPRKSAAAPASPKAPAAATTAAAVATAASEAPETAIAPEIEMEEASEEVFASAAAADEKGGVAQEKQGFLKNIFGSRQSQPEATEAKPTSLTAALDEIEADADFEEAEFEEDWEPEETPEAVATPEIAEAAFHEAIIEESEAVAPVAEGESEAAVEEISGEAETEAEANAPAGVEAVEAEAENQERQDS